MAGPKKKTTSEMVIEFGPLLIFFAFNFLKDIYWATGSLMITMPIAVGYAWFRARRVPPMLWVSGVMVLIFGGLTLYLQDPTFIKVKATVIFGLFGVILMVGFLFKKPFVKFMFQDAFPDMAEKGWLLLTRNWGMFFMAEAAINEVVWRTFSTDAWVTFKTFGFMALFFIFAIAQYPVIVKYGNLNVKR